MTSINRDLVQVNCRKRLDIPTFNPCVTVLSDTVVQVVGYGTYGSGTNKK
jgi:hypothetical protein